MPPTGNTTAVMSELSQTQGIRNHQIHHNFNVPLSVAGPPARWMGAVGDWSWDFVRRQCGVNVFRACNLEGTPSYLAFCYMRLLGSRGFPCNGISLGDDLEVTSSGFRGSSESVSVIHHIRRKDAPALPPRESYEEVTSGADEGSLVIEGFNRWVVRSADGDNAGLAKSAPPEFQSEHLPAIPDGAHPWRRYRPAMERLSFCDAPEEWETEAEAAPQPYVVDGDRDFNAVGLLYFATYFDLFQAGARDAAIRAGFSREAFQQRSVMRQEVVFAGNANAGERLEIVGRARRNRVTGTRLFDVVVRRETGETLAVSSETAEFGEGGRSRSGGSPRVIAINGSGAARTPSMSAPPEELRQRLLGFLERLIAETIGDSNSALPLNRTFGELGWDSCARLDVMSRLESFFGPVTAGLAFRSVTIESLALHLLQRHRSAVARLFAMEAPRAREAHGITADLAGRYEPFPPTDIQRAYLAGRSDAFPLGGKGCHLYWEFENAQWDPGRLQRAWRKLVEAHDMLRATFSSDGRQCVMAEVPEYVFAIHDWRDRAPEEANRELAGVRERISHTDFAPGEWPLFRIEVSLLPGSMRLHLGIDMLALDGPSLFLLLGQWSDLFEDESRENVPAAVSYRDYVLYRERLRQSEAYRNAQAYWSARNLPPAPEPVAGCDLTAIRKPNFRRLDARLDAGSWAEFQRIAKQAGLTAPAALLSAFADALRLWLRNPGFTINVTVANRLPAHPDIGRIAGDFTSNVLLAVDCSRPESFAARAARVQDQLTEDLDHSLVSGVDVLGRLSRERDASILMPVVFTSFLGYAGILKQEARWNGLGRFAGGLTETPQVWLDCQVLDDDGELYLSWDVADGALPDGLAVQMFTAFRALVERLARDERIWQALHRPILPDGQLESRRRANATSKAFEPAPIQAGFLEQARRYPDWTAVIDPRRELSYGELERLAARLAGDLRAAGASRNRLVAVVMEKGWEEVAAVLGIAMSGAAYLPIDASLPPQRIRQLLSIGEATIAVTQPHVEGRIDWPEGMIRIAIDGGEAPEPPALPDVEADPSDLAYVIFTSGSTGVPKGVMIEHRAAVNTIRDINERFAVGPRDRVLALSALNFDLSVYDIFGVLGAGGALVIPEAARLRDPLYLSELARRERVTIWNSVPSFLHMVVEAASGEAPLRDLRLAMMSGDWIPVQLPERIRELCPRARTISLGGATEASIWSICYPIGRVETGWKSFPYGKPLTNQSFHVLNEHLEDCPDGVAGELYIGGAGVAVGYWRDAEKTSASFIHRPVTGERLYRTGDWGTYLADGNIEFLGRADLQVKVGGHRVELGEIDAALAQCPDVAGGMAVTFTDQHGQKRLAAACVGKSGARIDVQRVRAALGAQLPPYMVPGRILQMASFPLTGNGKVDRKAVEVLAAQPEPGPPTSGGDPFLQAISSAAVAMDPVERERFVRARLAVRTDLEGAAVQLSGPPTADTIAMYERRRSSRTFADGPVDLQQMAGLLGVLREIETGGRRKHRFPSAGGSYPVQTYVHVKPGKARGIEAGVYYYHPVKDQLQWVSSCREFTAEIHAPANRSVSAGAGFSIFLIADMRAIQPLYGDLAADFAKLEAGYMGQLLTENALLHQIELCPIGFVWFEAIREHFRLTDDHVLLHSFLGGAAVAEGAAPFADVGSLEDRIAAIWGEVLRRPQRNREENFFEAGGTSFAAIEVHRRITGGMGIACTITDLFRHPTVRSLAARLEGRAPSPPASPAFETESGPSRRDRRRAARSSQGDGQ